MARGDRGGAQVERLQQPGGALMNLGTITGYGYKGMATIIAQLVREGVAFIVDTSGDNEHYSITLTGGF